MTGNTLEDKSLFDNHARIVGDPKLVEGLDYGLFGGTIALQTDGENDYFLAPEGNTGAGRITELSNFSIGMIIYPQALTSKSGGPVTLCQKIDDDGSYAYTVKLQDDGKLFVSVRANGSGVVKETVATPFADQVGGSLHDFLQDDVNSIDFDTGPANFFLTPDWFLIWVRSTVADPPVPSVYINNTSMTLQDSPLDYEIPFIDFHDTIIGATDSGNQGHYQGIWQDYRFMKRQVTTQEIANHWTNKLSISNIPYGQVFTYGGAIYARDAILLDGDNDFIDLGADTALWSRSLDKFTVAMWLRPNNAFGSPGNYRTFLGLADDPSENDEISFYFVKSAGSGLAYDSIGFDATKDGYSTQAQLYSSPSLVVANGNWYYTVVTFDKTLGSANYKMYVNGALQSSVNDVSNYAFTLAIDAATKMLLGKYISTDTNEYGGSVRDFKWWYNVPLTAQNVLDSYYGLDSLVPTPSYWLPMNEGTGNPRDSISMTKTGSLQNGATWTVV